MQKASSPYLRDLEHRGFIEGLTYIDKSSKPLCHYFGGIPYALPPVGPFRWQKPRPLPACYRYGTRANPGRYTGGCSICPQPKPNDELNTELWDEDCLQCNVWIPVGDPPKGGWPVLFWIHGGFLQFGDPNEDDLRAMLSETPCKAIVIAPAYRLNIFGFLASPELCEASPGVSPNVGFWDQRLALEWTWHNVSYFGGDASNITIGGYSAGSHSTFHQLAYDLGVSDSKSIVRRALMLSNGPGMQPKSFDEAQAQFNELLSVLQIPMSLSAAEKLAKLRTLEPKKLIQASIKMKYHQFRATTDGSFVRHGLLNEIDSGIFAAQMKRRGVRLIIGECKDEHFVYGNWRPPKNNLDSLFRRLQADYPLAACETLIDHYYPNGKLPANCKTWQEAFGRIYADIQIHALERGMVSALTRHGAGHLIHRYRMEWRAQCCDKLWPRGWGVTHGTDMAIWFWGNEFSLSKKEKRLVKNAFHDNFASFLNGEDMDWGTEHPLHVRTLTSKGTVVCEEDERLDEGLRVWDVLKRVGATGNMLNAKL
ncbi:paraben-hydrolyzing esterase precursor [Lindgomyces ingoldianus]|uniref:Paraben-hydrolyzing esterase n=1 Tax=Lindgomyces ingoldianus TaxID=673940 RepID=A0ACB6QQ66_9PLEO|nr:paraben-hydrolyzing esterase precursor [Lindgomyces ingoldianus]KAF2468432.1 paraben-hydrolyzing esterase precursor [Lindgomyces ingoldianus]